MLRRAFSLLLVLLVLSAGGRPHAQTPAAQPAVDPALIEQVLNADTDEARTALIDAHPELTTDVVRTAISQASVQRASAGDPARSLNGHRMVLLLAERTKNVRWRMLGLQGVGTLAGQRGDLSGAEPALQEALAIAESIGEPDSIFVASNNLGIVMRLQGRYDDALASYRRALDLAEKANRRDLLARVWNNLGIIAQRQGDARAALDYLTRSLTIREELGQVDDIVVTSLNVGELHQYQGNYARALDYYERARTLSEGTSQQRSLGAVFASQAEALAALGRFAEARDFAQRALERAKAQDDRLRLADGWYLLGIVASEERKWAEAEDSLQRSLAIREAVGEPNMTMVSLSALAELFLASGKPDAALGYAERSVAVARTIPRIQSRWGALSVLGSANAALGRHDAAVAAFEESIEVIEQGRRQVAGGADALERFFEEKTTAYYELAAVHAAQGRPADAFTIVERARARALLDVIDGGQPIVRELTSEERRREDELNHQLVSLSVQRTTAAARTPSRPGEVQAIDEALARVRRERDEWQLKVYAAHPDLRFGRGETPVTSLEGAQAVLSNDTAVAMFMSSPNRTRVLLIQRSGPPQLFTLPLTADALAVRARSFNQQLARRDLGFMPAARALYDALLGTIDARLPAVRHLVIVPDGPLWDVPFQALMTPRGRFVIEERAISYSPSVTALTRLQQRRQARATRAPLLVGIGDPGSRGARLPQTAREVEAIGAMYGARSRLFLGADATEQRFREAAGSATIVHVATHGEMVPDSPMYSFVALAPTGDRDPARDGRLEAWEIANLQLEADLVVLSACETGRGEGLAGEGVIGLAWSVFAAGATTAAVSLWRVDSSSTSELMLGFHRALRAKAGSAVNPSDAMRTAARSLIASDRYRHPFYWAGFVVVGAP